MNFLEALQTKDSLTYNGAVTHSTSLNSCVDLFFLAGASRAMQERDMINIFSKAYAENPELAMKILFWSRDCRGGAGERNFFQTVFKYWLKYRSAEYPEAIVNLLITQIPEFGYWKDIIKLDLVRPMVIALQQGNTLAAKWCPRHGNYADRVRESLKLTPKEFRKLLVSLSTTVEQLMCARAWDEIKYSSVPSVAFQNYKKAYERHDTSRFNEFIESVAKGETTVNSGQLFPYQLYQSFKKGSRPDVIDVQWKALPNYMEGLINSRMMPVCDVSGSMNSINFNGDNGNSKFGVTPMEISVSLGVYLSQYNEGPFKDAFITFSGNPQLQVLKGTVCERFNQLCRASWSGNTNLLGVFQLILDTARKNRLSNDQLPTTIVIISDMEFDRCATNTNYDSVKELYRQSGYDLPRVVFWNVNGRIGNVPVKAKQTDVALVSGASPAIVRSVLTGETMTPEGVMLKTVMSERYSTIKL